MSYEDQDEALALVFADQCTSAAHNALHAARLRKDRRPALAGLLAAISPAENLQSRRMLMQMRGKIDATATHLSALSRKKYNDFTRVFPKLAERSGQNGLSKAAEAFEQFGEVAKNHYDRICETVECSLEETMTFFLCQVCGYIAADFAPSRCSVCGAIEAKFSEVR